MLGSTDHKPDERIVIPLSEEQFNWIVLQEAFKVHAALSKPCQGYLSKPLQSVNLVGNSTVRDDESEWVHTGWIGW